eukprot:m.212934 g.212934  ORF g.212934 m.212934 type:complete len:123 (+) comp15509_c0_seq1:716-1084(+)
MESTEYQTGCDAINCTRDQRPDLPSLPGLHLSLPSTPSSLPIQALPIQNPTMLAYKHELKTISKGFDACGVHSIPRQPHNSRNGRRGRRETPPPDRRATQKESTIHANLILRSPIADGAFKG